MSTTLITKQRVEEMIRQRLGLADLSDPRRVAAALSRRYPELEAKFDAVDAGFLMGTHPVAPSGGGGSTIGSRELERVRRQLADDFAAVVEAAEVRESRDAFVGMREDALTDVDEAAAVAEQVVMGDGWMTVSAVCRKLVQHAGAARFSAVTTREAFWPLWRLADTLDAARWAILTRVGEAAFEAGHGNAEVPFTEGREALRTAARAVGVALRALLGLEPSDPATASDLAALGSLRTTLGSPRCLARPEEMERVLDRIVDHLLSDDPATRRQLFGTRAVRTEELLQIVQALGALGTPTEKTRLLQAALTMFLDGVSRASSLGRVVELVVPAVLRRSGGVGTDERQARDALAELLEVRARVKVATDELAAEEDIDGRGAREALDMAAELLALLDGFALDLVQGHPGADAASSPSAPSTGDWATVDAIRLAFQRRGRASRSTVRKEDRAWRERLADRFVENGHFTSTGPNPQVDELAPRVTLSPEGQPTSARPVDDPADELLFFLAHAVDRLVGWGGLYQATPPVASRAYRVPGLAADPNPATIAAPTGRFQSFVRAHTP